MPYSYDELRMPSAMVLTSLEGISRSSVESVILSKVKEEPKVGPSLQSLAVAKDADSLGRSQIALS